MTFLHYVMSWPPSVGVVRHPSQNERLVYLKNDLTHNNQILQAHPSQATLQPHWIWRHQLIPVCIYRSSTKGRKCSIRGFESNFSGAAFWVTKPIGVFLETYHAEDFDTSAFIRELRERLLGRWCRWRRQNKLTSHSRKCSSQDDRFATCVLLTTSICWETVKKSSSNSLKDWIKLMLATARKSAVTKNIEDPHEPKTEHH